MSEELEKEVNEESVETPEEEKNLFDNLESYCEQDTYAMVLLMDVLYKYAKI